MRLCKIYTIENGIIETDDYISDNIHKLTWHRTDGPAFTEYHDNGTIKYELYYVKDKKHRIDGPADIEYDNNCISKNVSYYIYGLEYTKEQYMKELLKLKINLL